VRGQARHAGARRHARALALAAGALLFAAGCGRFVILHDPLTAPEHVDLGVSYERAGRLDLAAREYRRALALDKRFGRAWLNLGNVEARRERWRDAEGHYRRALLVLPEDPDPPNNLAIVLVRRGRATAEAESLATRAVRLAPAGRDSLYRATLDEVRAARR
jgi:Flp pilus assembly protein TadD